MNVLYSLQHLGYTIAPQADAGWIGEPRLPVTGRLRPGADAAFRAKRQQPAGNRG